MTEEAFDFDSTGIKMDDDFTIPEDVYTLQIIKAKRSRSKVKEDGSGGYRQVVYDAKVVGGDQDGFPVNFQRVTFLPRGAKAAGLAIKFLKTIGEPWEGQFKVNPDSWLGKKFRGFLAVNTYQGKSNMQVKWVEPLDAPTEGLSGSPDLSHAAKQLQEEDVPF